MSAYVVPSCRGFRRNHFEPNISLVTPPPFKPDWTQFSKGKSVLVPKVHLCLISDSNTGSPVYCVIYKNAIESNLSPTPGQGMELQEELKSGAFTASANCRATSRSALMT